MTVALFVGTGYFSIRYSNGHMKYTHRQLKKFRDYLQESFKHLIHSSHHRNVLTDPLGTSRGSLGMRGAQFGNQWYRTTNYSETAAEGIPETPSTSNTFHK
jgi:hypothetical protein